MNLYARRRSTNTLVLALSLGATAIGVIALAAILWTLIGEGIAGMSLALFTQTTPPPGSKGGLMNAIYGSLIMTGLATLIGTPVGILAGT